MEKKSSFLGTKIKWGGGGGGYPSEIKSYLYFYVKK